MSYIPDYTDFKVINEKISFILGAWPDGDPDKPYDRNFEIEFDPKSSKADKAVQNIEKILKKNKIKWSPHDGMEYGLLIKKPTAHVLDAIFDMLPPSGVVDAMGWTIDESLDEAMAYKKAQKFTKKLNDDHLLKDLIYVANKIHDKMGTTNDVNDWLLQVITYGNKHPQMWKESLDEAAPKMTSDPDLEVIDDMVARIGALGRKHNVAHIHFNKAIKSLQAVRHQIRTK